MDYRYLALWKRCSRNTYSKLDLALWKRCWRSTYSELSSSVRGRAGKERVGVFLSGWCHIGRPVERVHHSLSSAVAATSSGERFAF